MRRALTIALLAMAIPAVAAAEERPTVQQRYAVKRNSVSVHGAGTMLLRNDFYNTFGGGLDVGYYPWESLGIEVRALLLSSRLSPQAKDVQVRTGLTPDARPQNFVGTLGARWSWGYGKILALDRAVMHFDPQLSVGLGVANAEARWLPTALVGVGLLVHLRWGLQVKLDLNAAIQTEERNRGWVTSVGFMPVVAVGWKFNLGGER